MEEEIAAGEKHSTVSGSNEREKTVSPGQFHTTPKGSKFSQERRDFMQRSPSEEVLVKYRACPPTWQKTSSSLGQSHVTAKGSKLSKERRDFMQRSPSEEVLVKYMPSPPTWEQTTVPSGQSQTTPMGSKVFQERRDFMQRSPSQELLVKYMPSPPTWQQTTAPSGQCHVTPKGSKLSKERRDFMQRSPSEEVLVKYMPSPPGKSKESPETSRENRLTVSGSNEQQTTAPSGQPHATPKGSKFSQDRRDFMQRSPSQEMLMKYMPSPPMKSKQSGETSRSGDKMSRISNHRGRRVVSHYSSAPLLSQSPIKTSPFRTSPSPRKPNSAPVQMSSAFYWPLNCEEQSYRPEMSNVSTLEEVNRRQEDDVDRLWRRKMKNGQWDRASASHQMLEKNGEKEEVFKVKNMEQNSQCSNSYQLSSDWKVEEGQNVPFSAPKLLHQRDPKMSKTQQVEEREMRTGRVADKSDGSSKSKMNDCHTNVQTSQVRGKAKRYNHVPQQEGFSKTEKDGSQSTTQSDFHFQEEDFEGFHSATHMKQDVRVVIQKAMNSRHTDCTTDVKEQNGDNDLTPVSQNSNLNVAKYVAMRKSSPDSFVAQLIANSKTLTLYDSVESPTLQERKKKRSNIKKNG